MDQGPLVMNTTTARVFASVAIAAIVAAAVAVAEGAFARWTVLIECSKGGDQSQRVLLLLSAAAAAAEKFPLISFAQATVNFCILTKAQLRDSVGGGVEKVNLLVGSLHVCHWRVESRCD